VRVNARSEPNAVVLNRTDAQNIDLLKVNNEPNNVTWPGRTVSARRCCGTFRWSRPTPLRQARLSSVTSPRRCYLTRQSLAIALGTINDQFLRNLVTVLGEIRAGFGVVRPAAFIKATLA
jgi:hypothetical protein